MIDLESIIKQKQSVGENCNIYRIACIDILGVEKTNKLLNGPGTRLKLLLNRLGIEITKSCPCEDYALQMDVWGPKICLLKLDEIVKKVKESQTKRKTLKAAYRSVITGLIFKIGIWSPIRNLVRLSITHDNIR